jgi:hypothetical protein
MMQEIGTMAIWNRHLLSRHCGGAILLGVSLEYLLRAKSQASTRKPSIISTGEKSTTTTMKERASEPSHLRPPLDYLTLNSSNHSSHAAMQRNQQNEEKAQRFDVPHFQPLSTSYMQIQYFFYGVENLCTLLPSARVIRNHPVISFSTNSYRTVLTSTKPYFTAQRYSTAQTSPTQSSVLSTRTVLSLMNAQSPTTQSPFTKQSPTVQSSSMQQSSTVKSLKVQPPTMLPPTVQPPTMLPPTVQSSTVQPLTVQPLTVQPPTVHSLTVQPPTMLSSSTVQPPTVQMQFQMQLYLPKFEIFPHYSHPPYHAWMAGDDVM